MDSILILRDELYEKVWAKAAEHVAADYGISGPALAKICRKLDVPVPPRGYWARHAAGTRTRRPPLPKLRPGEPDRHIIRRSPREERRRAEVAVARELGAAIDVGPLTPVAELLTDPHRLIRKHDKLIRRIAKTGASIPHDKPCLDVVVAESSVDRGLRIMDAVLKSMDSRRWPVVVTAARKCSRDGVWASTTAEVEGEAIEFGLSEVFDSVVIGQRDRPASLLDVVRPRRPEIVRERRGTGRLRLEIKATVQLPRRSWGDSRGIHLENLLAEFFAGIHVAVAALKAQHERERLQALERAREDEARRVAAERQARQRIKMDDLKKRMVVWQEAARIRDFTSFVTTTLEPTPKLATWIEWASTTATELEDEALNDLA
jgi:hypothetical protein